LDSSCIILYSYMGYGVLFTLYLVRHMRKAIKDCTAYRDGRCRFNPFSPESKGEYGECWGEQCPIIYWSKLFGITEEKREQIMINLEKIDI